MMSTQQERFITSILTGKGWQAMKHIELLDREYSQQYEQYRWIGRQQATVLAVYGGTATLVIWAISAFRPHENTQIGPYSLVLGLAVFVLGLLGLVLGFGLCYSRLMQERIGVYLNLLRRQIAAAVDDSDRPSHTALRFQGICSTGRCFSLLDTINVAILTVLFLSWALTIAGVCLVGVSFSLFLSLVLLATLMIAIGWASIYFFLKSFVWPRQWGKITERFKELKSETGTKAWETLTKEPESLE